MLNSKSIKNAKVIDRLIAYDGICSSYLIDGSYYVSHFYNQDSKFYYDYYFKASKSLIDELKEEQIDFKTFIESASEIYKVRFCIKLKEYLVDKISISDLGNFMPQAGEYL
jgi:hypothetical protein